MNQPSDQPAGDEPSPVSTTAAPGPVARGSRPWVATAALVALGVAIAVAVYVGLQVRSGPGAQVSGLRQDLGSTRSGVDSLNLRVEELAGFRRRLGEDMERLDQRLSSQSGNLASLATRLENVEQNVERLTGAGDDVRRAWLLSEAEHYMRIANAQLGLAGDVEVAQTALGLADDTLRELADPRLTPVRRLLAEEIAALKAVPRPDTEGIVLTLGSLADGLEHLPLKRSAPDAFRNEVAPPTAAAGGTERAVAAVRGALNSLVSIRRTDVPVTPLLPETEQALLIRSLDLELQLARLAVMRGDAGMFRRSIEAAAARVGQHFDPRSADVQSALQTLRDLQTVALPEELPDISGSLPALLDIVDQGMAR